MALKIGIVGATGMVGEAFMDILTRHKIDIAELRPFASENSVGHKIQLAGKEWECQVLKPNCFKGLDVVFFSSGDDISKEWAPQAVEQGAFAIDNSAAYRMDPNTPLIVPEVNGELIPAKDQPTLIANPNCSTIQLVVALSPLKKFGLSSIKVATYQAVSGSGKAAKEELLEQCKSYLENGKISKDPEVYPHQIAFNCIPHIGGFNGQGFCSEEVKIQNETKKILNLPDLKVSAFTVRIPALNGHSEAAWVTFDKEVSENEIMSALESADGIQLVPQNKPEDYPTSFETSGTEPVYVGRVHQDPQDKKTWMLWVVADNILKGAALNGLQIAKRIYDL